MRSGAHNAREGVATAPSRPASEFIERFALPTRLAHWALAVPFLLLLLTGLTNFFPELKSTQVADVRLFAWLQNFRRLVVRYEYHQENFLGFVHLGCILILLRCYL